MGLKTGDVIPKFTAKDANGNDFESQSILGRKPVVIYFYPKDDTSVCTAQACSFRDQYEDFTTLGAEVIGISSDSETSHQKFIKKYQLPFILLSDTDKKIRNLFGVPPDLLGLISGRATYVVDKKGIIAMVFDSRAGLDHIPKALDAIKKLV